MVQTIHRSKRYALNEGTIPGAGLARKIEVVAKAGYSGIGIWMAGVREFLADGHSLEDLPVLLANHQLDVVELNYLKDWLFAIGSMRERALFEARTIAYMARVLSAGCMTVAAFGESGSLTTAVENFRLVCDIAKEYQVRVAFEFLPWQKVATVSDAWKIVDGAGRDNGGLLLDTFHFFEGGSRLSDLDHIPSQKIFLVHINDLPRIECTDLVYLTRHRRVFPGQGQFDLKGIIAKLHEIRYEGPFSLEVFNDNFHYHHPQTIANEGIRHLELLFT